MSLMAALAVMTLFKKAIILNSLNRNISLVAV